MCFTRELAGSVIGAICNVAISCWETFHFYSLPTEGLSNTMTKKSRAVLFFASPRVQARNQGHGCSVHRAISTQFPRSKERELQVLPALCQHRGAGAGSRPCSLCHMVSSCLVHVYASPDVISTLTCVK